MSTSTVNTSSMKIDQTTKMVKSTTKTKKQNTSIISKPREEKVVNSKMVQQQAKKRWFWRLLTAIQFMRRHSPKSIVPNELTVANPATISYLRLARERRFDDIITVLTQSSTTLIASWLQVQQETRTSICECLHALCLYRPTPTVVKAVQDAIKSAHIYSTIHKNTPAIAVGLADTDTGRVATVNAALVTDSHGRTPLHIAVACGCSFAVVETLLEDGFEAAYMMDHNNRYPLHWACTCSFTKANSKSIRSREHEVNNAVKIINRLMEIYAMAVISKDNMGCTPLDIAIAAKADQRIISALQFVKNILPMKKRTKSQPDEPTIFTRGTMNYPIQEAICMYDDDDVSSIGSRGISKPRRCRRTRSESPRGTRIRELVHL